MSNTFPLTPPPPPPVSLIVVQPPPDRPSSIASSLVIVVIIVASAVIASATIYILLRFLSRRFHRSFRTFATANDVVPPPPASAAAVHPTAPSELLISLPLFQFGSVTGNLTGGDCAVCLSKFEPRDQLRLLPLCCHAFHAECIDAWIVANQTCPLCRSTVVPSDSDIFDKLAAADRLGDRSGSFRVEIGSVSRRREGSAAGSGRQRSFSIGSFEYVLDGNAYEVPVGSTNDSSNHRADSGDKESFVGITMPAEATGGGARNWLREYVDRLGSISMSSRAVSFRSSGRFFSGSSRRSEVAVAAEDLEANRVGEEISELFRWLSGI